MMSQWIKKYRPLLFLAISILVGVFTTKCISIPASLLDTLYTVLGISFSLSVSHSLSIDFSQIKNRGLRKRLMRNAKNQFNSFVIMFVLATVFFVFSSLLKSRIYIPHFNLDYCTLTMLILSLAYTSVNFAETTKLKNDIADRIAEDE